MPFTARCPALLAVALALTTPALAQIVQPSPPGSPPELAAASQLIIPQARAFALRRPQQPPAPAGIQITSVEVRARILDQTASTTMEIGLANSSSRQEQAVLLLPVPDGGAVVGAFAFEGQASEPTAQVLPAEEARRLYDSIVAQIRDPALLEFAGYNLIRTSVFPVEPGGTQKVRLTYEHLLETDGNRVDYVLPRSESLERRRPWRISVQVRSTQPISTVYSPSHEMITERRGDSELHVHVQKGATDLPGPFRLSYLKSGEGVTASLMAYPDPAAGGGYFLLMAGLPAQIADDSDRLKREVTVVIDRSGSMAGGKLDQVRAAALQIIEGLEDREAFNIVDYASTVSMFSAAPVLRSDSTIKEARDYLASIRPGGGTNIHDALLEALRQEPVDGMLPLVLFLTDGLPTIGRTNELTIREMVQGADTHERRVFTFGVGQDVNVPLLDRIADATRATATHVLPDEDVEVKVARVFRRTYGPVLAAPVIQTADADGELSTRLAAELIPDPLPDLFEGDQLILLGQYRQDGPITFQLSGNYLGRQRTFEFELDPTTATTRNAFVPRLWASRRIALLVDEIRQAGAATSSQPLVAGTSMLVDPKYQELVDEILRLSTEFGILTEYTAFLATEGTDLSNWQELKDGCQSWLDRKAVRTRSGTGALNQALNYNHQKLQSALNYANTWVNEQLNEVSTTRVQQVCDRAFFRRGNRWIDSRLLPMQQQPEPDEVLTIGSEAHFDLLNRLVREGRQGVLSLNGEILLRVDDRVVLVKDGC